MPDPVYNSGGVSIYHGDVLDVLRKLPDGIVQTCVTSPPYWGLRTYGVEGQLGLEPTPEEFIAKMVSIFREVRRVLRDDGTLWLNLGDSYTSGNRDGHGTRVGYKQSTNRGATDETSPERAPVPPGLKPKDLCGIPWRVALALQADGWYLRSDIIWSKCLSGGTRVYARTQKGVLPMTIKDMVRLDPSTVELWNGERWVRAVSWTETPRPDDALEIVLRNGERIGCTPDHRWPTTRGMLPASELIVGDRLRHTQLPDELAYAPRCVPDELGWVVGLYIAEGSRGKDGKVLQFASHANEIDRFATLTEYTSWFGGSCRMHDTSENGTTINVYSPMLGALIAQYVSGKDAHTKHLSPAAWKRSNEFLYQVLHGYLSGDGHRRQNEWRLGFCDNDNLADDLRTLGARLNLSVRLKRTHHTMDGRKFPGWRGSIRSLHDRRSYDREIVEIGKSRARKFWDIEVEGEPHVFALASGVVTHNSNPMPESCTDRPTKAHEYIFLMSKAARYYYDADAVREEVIPDPRDARWGTTKTGARTDHSADLEQGLMQKPPEGWVRMSHPLGRNKRTVWQCEEWQLVENTEHDGHKPDVWNVATQPYSGAHFATYPPKLIEPCILAGATDRACAACGKPWRRVVDAERVPTRPGNNTKTDGKAAIEMGNRDPQRHVSVRTDKGFTPDCKCGTTETRPSIVLDPFMGSGTTAEVARKHGCECIGIELNAEYIELAGKRLAQGVLEFGG